MAWYILYPERLRPSLRCKLVKKKPLRKVTGYGFAEGPLATLKDVSHRLNAMGIYKSRRPMRQGRII